MKISIIENIQIQDIKYIIFKIYCFYINIFKTHYQYWKLIPIFIHFQPKIN